MYLLILYAFLHANKPEEHVVVDHFLTRDACFTQADKRNHDIERQPGDVVICASVQFPS